MKTKAWILTLSLCCFLYNALGMGDGSVKLSLSHLLMSLLFVGAWVCWIFRGTQLSLAAVVWGGLLAASLLSAVVSVLLPSGPWLLLVYLTAPLYGFFLLVPHWFWVLIALSALSCLLFLCTLFRLFTQRKTGGIG